MGSEQRHTPGPWRVMATAPGYFADIYGGGEFVARVAVSEAAASDTRRGGYRESMCANTDLIESAPDLYAALAGLLDGVDPDNVAHIEGCEEGDCIYCRARAALAKARGEDPR